MGPGHSDWHIYEIDLPIIVLSVADSDDWLYTQMELTMPSENWALVSEGVTVSEDWGQISSGIGGALQLGPMRRQIDRLKFAKQCGFSTLKTDLGSNDYTINFFKDEQISRYVTTQNEKTRFVMNSHITIV